MTQKKVNFIYALNRGGGVEKNFVIISNYLGKKFKFLNLSQQIKHITNFFKKLTIINPNLKLNSFYPRRLKYFLFD